MKHIEIPGLRNGVSRLIMGSDYFMPEVYDLVRKNLDAFAAIGGNTIDTAFIYREGRSEQAIGMWVEERGNRSEINLWTKGAHPNKDGKRVNRAAIQEELSISLERLRTDYVDLYALHRDDTDVPVGEILEILNEQVEAGRILAFGASNWTWQRLAEAQSYAESHGLRGFSFSSPNLALAKAKEAYWDGCISVDEETLQWHGQSKLPIFSWSSQARGFFTGASRGMIIQTPIWCVSSIMMRTGSVTIEHRSWQSKKGFRLYRSPLLMCSINPLVRLQLLARKMKRSFCPAAMQRQSA